jgi:hypothetical protein
MFKMKIFFGKQANMGKAVQVHQKPLFLDVFLPVNIFRFVGKTIDSSREKSIQVYMLG